MTMNRFYVIIRARKSKRADFLLLCKERKTKQRGEKMKKTTLIFVIVSGLFGYIFGRQDENMKQMQRIDELELELGRTEANAYDAGFNVCLKQF